MNRTLKVVIVALALMVAGAVLAGCGLWGIRGDWEQFSIGNTPVTTQDTITEDFSNIDFNMLTADVALYPSPDGTCYYVAKTYDNMFIHHNVENGTLRIGQDDNRQWHHYIGISWEETSLTLYLPKEAYENLTFAGDTSDLHIPADFRFQSVTAKTDTGDVEIKAQVAGDLSITTSTGDIRLGGVAAANISAATSTGDVTIYQSKCDNLSVSTTTGRCQLDCVNVAESLFAASSTGEKILNKADCGSLNMKATTGDTHINNVNVAADAQLESNTGDWELYNLVVTGDAKMESSTGDWELDNCDAANIRIETSTGDVEGTLRSEKIFFVDSNTGDIEVPRTTSGGTCEITTDTGDIEIDIRP